MVFFVDDLNLPALDAYNTQSAIALIRQHMDYGHWWAAVKMGTHIERLYYFNTINRTKEVNRYNTAIGEFRRPDQPTGCVVENYHTLLDGAIRPSVFFVRAICNLIYRNRVSEIVFDETSVLHAAARLWFKLNA